MSFIFSKCFSNKFSIYSIGTSYGKSQSTIANDNSLDKLTIFVIPLWLQILILPAASISFVLRIPISKTLPLKSSITIVSPTLNSFSNTKKTPAMISAINVWAPRPTIRASTPTEAINAAVSTPNAFKIKINTAIPHPYLTNASNNVMIVFTLLDFVILTLKIVHKSLKKSYRNSFFNKIYLLLLQYV